MQALSNQSFAVWVSISGSLRFPFLYREGWTEAGGRLEESGVLIKEQFRRRWWGAPRTAHKN